MARLYNIFKRRIKEKRVSLVAWFISDNHFNHENIIKYCHRPFDSVGEMDNYMVKKWNSVVSESDLIYHLGDFALGLTPEEYKGLLAELNGKIILIRGNHDRVGKKRLLEIGFLEVHNKLLIKNYLLTHRPQPEETLEDGVINIHGHIHNHSYREGVDTSKYINTSVEVNEYKPIWIDIS